MTDSLLDFASDPRLLARDERSLPRLAFLGVGWIGRNRMEAVIRSGGAEVVGIADPAADVREAASSLAPDAARVASLDDLLALEPDGVVIATPSALHAEQAITALRSGSAVFCQKPIGRTGAEVVEVVRAAREADRLLEADFSYRFAEGMQRIRPLIEDGELGDLYAIELVFHNAYGPDKPWFYDASLSGGGCVMDLGIHLVDLALWVLGYPRVSEVDAHLLAGGRPLDPGAGAVEDYASAQLRLETGAVVRLACSWRLPAGRDAVIEAGFYGTRGGAALRNVGGSFYDFVAERFDGTARTMLAEPPDAWGGRAIVAWAERLRDGHRFDPAAARFVDVAEVLDRIYHR